VNSGYGGIHDPDNSTSKCGIPACELIDKCGKDFLEFFPVEVVPRAEACTESSIVRNHFGERLRDGRLSRSRQTVEQKGVPILRIFGPLHNTIEDGLSSSP